MATADLKQISDWTQSIESRALTAIVQRAVALINASGAAIALATPDAGELDCCARSGRTAPELGRSVLAEGTLTALCVRSGQRLLCDDVETDPRVCSTGLIDLGVRSVVLTPILQKNRVAGVLTVLADRADAFSAMHLAELDAAAIKISHILEVGEPSPGLSRVAIQDRVSQDRVSQDEDVSRPKPPVSAWRSVFVPQAPLPPVDIQVPQEAKRTDLFAPGFATLDSAAARQRKLPGRLIATVAALFVISAGAAWFSLAGSARSIPGFAATPPMQRASSELAATTVSHSSTIPADAATIRVDPERMAARQGSAFSLSIAFSGPPGVASIAMQITYDPKMMQFVSVSQDGFSSEESQQFVLAHRDDPLAGVLKISAQRPLGDSSAFSHGLTFALMFRARERGRASVSITPGVRDDRGRAVDMLGSQASISIN